MRKAQRKESRDTLVNFMKNTRQVVLLRVAIDTGCGGMLGPIFADDSFEFIPIPASEDRPDRLGRTYGNTDGRHGTKLVEYFPENKQKKMGNCCLHFDPEFKSCTYGDPTSPKQTLKKLQRGDLLVFYAGLKGWSDYKMPQSLYIIGYFIVREAGTYTELKQKGLLHLFVKNQHILNGDTKGMWIGKKRKRWLDLILVKGGHGSRLLSKAVKISTNSKDSGNHPIFVLDPKMKRYFGNFGGSGLNAIQRSTPRWIKPEFSKKAVAFVLNLK
jgi:hypothetical protein